MHAFCMQDVVAEFRQSGLYTPKMIASDLCGVMFVAMCSSDGRLFSIVTENSLELLTVLTRQLLPLIGESVGLFCKDNHAARQRKMPVDHLQLPQMS